MYYSRYDDSYLDALANRLVTFSDSTTQIWCNFDKKALGAATENA